MFHVSLCPLCPPSGFLTVVISTFQITSLAESGAAPITASCSEEEGIGGKHNLSNVLGEFASNNQYQPIAAKCNVSSTGFNELSLFSFLVTLVSWHF